MPLFDVIGLGGEKHAVVIDIGAACTKCGFATEVAPRHVIPSFITHTVNGKMKTVRIVGGENKHPDELYAILRDYIHQIYFRYLLVNPRDRRVVICESVLCPTVFREVLAKVLFKHFEVPSILFAPCHLMALFTLGIQTGLVIDCGYSETVVLPVYEGIPIIKACETISLAGKAIHSHLEEQLMEKSLVQIETGIKPLSSVLGSLSDSVLEDIKVRTCFVAPKFSGPAGEPRPASLVPQLDYPLDGGRILRIEGQIREQIFDILFDGNEEEKSIATTLLDSLLQSPIDTRKPLAENIVLIGGTTMTPGFKHRCLQEIFSLLQSPRYKENLFIKNVKIHNTPVGANCTAWLGGAIFGSLEILADRSVTRERYIQDKKIPDWSSCENRTFDMVPLLDEPSPLRPVLSRRQTSGITSTLSSLSSALSSRILVGGTGRLSSGQGTGSSSRTSTKSSIIKESAAETKKDSSSSD